MLAGSNENNFTNANASNPEILKKETALKEKKNEEKESKSKRKLMKTEGDFKTNLPKSIIKHKSGKFNTDESISKQFYKVEWELDEEGNKPKSRYYSLEDLKIHCPLLLIEYFQDNAILLDPNKLLCKN